MANFNARTFRTGQINPGGANHAATATMVTTRRGEIESLRTQCGAEMRGIGVKPIRENRRPVSCRACIAVLAAEVDADFVEALSEHASRLTEAAKAERERGIEFPTPICSETAPHGKHRIAGTWRTECPGIETEAPECICDDSNLPARKDCPYCYPADNDTRIADASEAWEPAMMEYYRRGGDRAALSLYDLSDAYTDDCWRAIQDARFEYYKAYDAAEMSCDERAHIVARIRRWQQEAELWGKMIDATGGWRVAALAMVKSAVNDRVDSARQALDRHDRYAAERLAAARLAAEEDTRARLGE